MVVGAAALMALTLPALYAVPSALAASTGSSSGWIKTATKPFILSGATTVGPLSPTTRMQIVVGLKQQHQAGLKQYIQAISTQGNALYGEHLTSAEFDREYAPTASQVSQVVTYLESQGFSSVTTPSNHLMIVADGTAAEVEHAFRTTLDAYQLNGHNVFANTTAAEVPQSLSGTVLSVLGLNNVAKMSLPIQFQKPSTSAGVPQYLVSYNPQGFWKAYDAAYTPANTTTNIAIFAEGDLSQVGKDLRTEEAANGLPQVKYQIVPTGIASTDTSGIDEWDLDSQYSTGMADMQANATLYMYDATSLTDSDTALEFNKFVTQDVAKAGSASFGECEAYPYLDGAMLLDDEAFAEAAAQGQTVFASSGDTGGACAVAPTNGVPMSGPPEVNYPAASPYVVAVGGTTLLTHSDGSYDEELAWAGSGGGASDFESSPYWQSGIVPATTNVGKGVPDIAMDADPESGANVYIDGVATGVGGTSLSSPLALGSWARFENADGNHLGFGAPILYAQNGTPGFHDITLGDSGPYPATPGWDFATGMGTLDLALMAGQLTGHNYTTAPAGPTVSGGPTPPPPPGS